MTTPIHEHEGKKYLRTIWPATEGPAVDIDVYAVLEAFDVTCPAIQHCIKKLLMAGRRGKGNRLDDLVGALAALNRAIEMEKIRDQQRKKDKQLYEDGIAVRENYKQVLGHLTKSNELEPRK